jgi:hypothetical protein
MSLSVTGTPLTAVNSGAGTAWSTGSAPFLVDFPSSGDSKILKLTNCNFALSAGATPVGVVATVDRGTQRVGSSGSLSDKVVKLLKASTAVGSNKLGGMWPLSATGVDKTYGDPTDLWGTTLTATDVNNSGFGLEIQVTCSIGGADEVDGTIFSVSLTVYYYSSQSNVVGSATVIAAIQGIGGIQSSVSGAATETGNVQVTGSSQAIIAGTSVVTASVFGTTAKRQITGGNFQDALGHPLDAGYLTFRLNTDAHAGAIQVVAGSVVTVPLDSNGSVSGTVYIWPNDQLVPSDTVYIVTAYSAAGQQVWRSEQTIPSGVGSFDLNTWVP